LFHNLFKIDIPDVLLYRLCPEGRSKNVYVHVSHSERFSLYSSKIVDKKETLRTVSNTGIYCSCDKVGAVYLV
jgi:hypothetical protein